MSGCRVCRSAHIRHLTDFGALAATNQFLPANATRPYRHTLSWQACGECGLVQLKDTPPIEQIRPRFPWIHYQEPERHLDETADLLRKQIGQSPSRAFGLTYKDAPLLQRLAPLPSVLLDPLRDFEIQESCFGLETIQAAWTAERARQVLARHGPADLLLARHILEHTFDTTEFLNACRTLLQPNGYLVLEVPDCERAFRQIDLSVLWEEHLLYFTELSLRRSLTIAGFETLHLQRAKYPIEDCLVWIGRPAEKSTVVSRMPTPTDEALPFVAGWSQRAGQFHNWAASLHEQGRRLAIFGAGHRACTLIDLAGVTEFVDCVIDDSPEKQQLRFPAGGLPICPSQVLMEHRLDDCLLVVNPDAEQSIVERLAPFTAAGGSFASWYPASSRAIRLS